MYTRFVFFLSRFAKTFLMWPSATQNRPYGQPSVGFGIVTHFSFKARTARKPGAVLVRRTQGYPG
jgi:hypothetical protein